MSYGFYEDEVADLPHKAIPLSIFLIVEDAIRASWECLRDLDSSKFDLQTAEEDKITHELYEILIDQIFDKEVVEGFDEVRFSIPTRESKIRNFNGDNLDKMPDLLFGVRGRSGVFKRSQDWLFIECKPVNALRTVGVHYGAKGIARFIRGDYAWAMAGALMVGYVSNGYSIETKLFETLAMRGKEFEVAGKPERCPSSPISGNCDHLYKTVHNRTFCYVENGKNAPKIELRHLWLKNY